MENLFDLKYGVAGLCVVLTIFIMLKVGEFFLMAREKKDTASDEAIKNLTAALQDNTYAIKHMSQRIENVENIITELPRFRADVRKIYAAIAVVAEDKWAKIKEDIMENPLYE